MTRIYLCLFYLLIGLFLQAQDNNRSKKARIQFEEGFQYCTTLNNGPEGPNGKQTLANLDFFIWMQQEYDFRLGSYAIDLAGTPINQLDTLLGPEYLEVLFPQHHQQIKAKAKTLQAEIEFINSSDNIISRTHTEVNRRNTKPTKNKRACNIEQEYHPKNDNTAGVCFSSSLDNWDDELIMQVFNHNTYKRPRIYGNPWLLKDSEFSKLGRINALYQEYRNILPKRIYLPDSYGVNAMSRGSKSKRLLTLTNMSWETKMVTIKLDEEIGLKEGKKLEVRSYHPTEKIIGYFPHSQILELPVPPFRTTLYYIGPAIQEDVTITGLDYMIEKNNKKEIQYRIMEPPVRARIANIRLHKRYPSYKVNGKETSEKYIERFRTKMPRSSNTYSYYQKMIGSFKEIDITPDSETLFEATIFSTDNNAHEARSLTRSMGTSVKAIREAQNAFFNQSSFIEQEAWDKYLFDGKLNTAFAIHDFHQESAYTGNNCLRVDTGKEIFLDELTIHVENEKDLLPQRLGETYTIETSVDLITWIPHTYAASLKSSVKIESSVRYFRLRHAPNRIVEFEGIQNEVRSATHQWKASNLFPHPSDSKPTKIVKYKRRLRKIHGNSYLYISFDGKHGVEGVYVAAKVNGEYIGCSDRSISYPSNNSKLSNNKEDSNYTYFLPLTDEMMHENIEIFVMYYDEQHSKVIPSIYMISDQPFNTNTLNLIK